VPHRLEEEESPGISITGEGRACPGEGTGRGRGSPGAGSWAEDIQPGVGNGEADTVDRASGRVVVRRRLDQGG